MTILLALAGVIIGLFGFVVLRGAPYLPTLRKQVATAFDLLELKPGDTVLELGCGDGKVLIAAAERGLNAVGYELNPLLALIAWVRTRRFKGRVQVVYGDFWRKQWPPAEGIFVFLLDSFMEKLDTRIVQYTSKIGKKVKLVSFAFEIPGRKADKQKDALFLYTYN